MDKPQHFIQEDPWADLKAFTRARIALGAVGASIPLREVLQFRLAHADAKDAVYSALQAESLADSLTQLGVPIFSLKSRAKGRSEYLQRPDWGRRLNEASTQILKGQAAPDVAIVVADGLSATAMNHHALPVLELLVPHLQSSGLQVALAIVEQGRVAIGDEIGELLGAKLVAVMIGERPGLSSPDSMGVYVTFNPKVGLTDESRNCISNIRPEGLPYQAASEKMYYLMMQALHLKLSGVGLKDEAGLI